jgi:hypothetical protein
LSLLDTSNLNAWPGGGNASGPLCFCQTPSVCIIPKKEKMGAAVAGRSVLEARSGKGACRSIELGRKALQGSGIPSVRAQIRRAMPECREGSSVLRGSGCAAKNGRRNPRPLFCRLEGRMSSMAEPLAAAGAATRPSDFTGWMLAEQARIFRLCQRMLGDSDEAGSATQDVFLKAYQAWERTAADLDDPSKWVTRIAVLAAGNSGGSARTDRTRS